MTTQPTVADFAAFYRMGVEYKFITPEEVMEWADRIILEENEPDPEVIDVSLNVGNPKVMTESLHKLSSGSTDRVVYGLVIRRLGDYLIGNESQVRETLQLIRNVCHGYEYELDEMAGIHDT